MLSHQTYSSAVVRDISNSLSSGKIMQSQAEVLRAAFGNLEYCSIGVYAKDYGTVIVTDNMVNAGFVDLSLCPLRMSLVGCVISRGIPYHDNVSTHRNGIPLDITRAVQRYGIKCAACIPIKLAAVASGGSTVASEHILGTLMLGSCRHNGVSVEHRNIAQSVAAALAPGFADATSSMYKNITDYVLGPMHGQPYPITSQRPLPKHLTDLLAGCRSDDSDHPDDAPASGQAQPVTEADSCNTDSADMGPFILYRLDPESVATLTSRPAVPLQLPESQPSMASASSHFTLEDHARTPSSQADPKSSSELKDRPSVQKGGASPQTHGSGDSADDDDDRHDDDGDNGSDKDDDDHGPVLRRRVLNSASGEVEGQSRQSGNQLSSGFSLPGLWRKGKRPKSDDSAQENSLKGRGSESPAGNSPEAEGKAEGLVKGFAAAAVDYRQHKLRLNFVDARVERKYCAWQGQQRTKLQLLYTLVIIASATCVGYITPPQERGPLLIWPPFLQLLPLITLSIDPNRYYRNSEWMHIVLNITKTLWAVCFGVPRQSPFWTPGRQLAIAWKFGIDSLLVSGLGELGRFSTFLWLQALDLVIVIMRLGGMCTTSTESDLSVRQCVVLVFVSNFLITYLFAGSLVWYMDKLARESFVRQQQHVSIDAAAG